MRTRAEIDGWEDWERWVKHLGEDIAEDVADHVEKTALKIERDAKLRTPVDTGRLRSSIHTEMEVKGKQLQAEVGTDVEYALPVELGTSTQSAQPYLIPAFNKNTRGFEKQLRDIVNGGLR